MEHLFGNLTADLPRTAWGCGSGQGSLVSLDCRTKQQVLAPFSSTKERCYSFCFSDYEISHFLGSLFIESSAHMQHQAILNTAGGQGALRCKSICESLLGPLPEVSEYFGYLSAPSQRPALTDCPQAGVLFRKKKKLALRIGRLGIGVLDPNFRGHDVQPGASQTPLLCLSILICKITPPVM